MTTFQDQPPQSRRAVRQSERNSGADPEIGAPKFSGESQPQPIQYSFDPHAVAPAPTQQGRRSPENPVAPSGRRAQRAAPSQPAQPEPLTYVTQGRTPGSSGAVSPYDHIPPAAPEQPAYRVRDFSPDGRRAALGREQAAAPQLPSTPVPSDLDYFTRAAAPAPQPAEPLTRSRRQAQPAADPVPQPHEQTMSRRELRELRAAQQRLEDPGTSEAMETLLESGPINLPVLAPPPGQSQALADAMAEFDALTGGSRGRRSAPSPVAAPPAAAVMTPPVEVTQPPVQTPAMAANDSPVNAPLPELLVEPIFIEPTPPTKPTGHWSLQAELDDENEFVETTVSRSVGSGSSATTTSLLVMPSAPVASTSMRPFTGDALSPFAANGEIIVTGTISLPHSLGATGAHPHRVDSSDVDDDPFDQELISTDSAPVRALNAVSTHTSTRGVIATSKNPGNNKMLTALVVSASVMAAAVVGLMALAVSNGILF